MDNQVVVEGRTIEVTTNANANVNANVEQVCTCTFVFNGLVLHLFNIFPIVDM